MRVVYELSEERTLHETVESAKAAAEAKMDEFRGAEFADEYAFVDALDWQMIVDPAARFNKTPRLAAWYTTDTRERLDGWAFVITEREVKP